MGQRVSLAALATESTAAAGAGQPVAAGDDAGGGRARVPLSTIATNPCNARPPGLDDELVGMAETIREHGVIQPLVVCSAAAFLARYPEHRDSVNGHDWVALIGNRRAAAARLAAVTEVDIVVDDRRIDEMYEVMLVENGQRRALPPWLEAEAMDAALRHGGLSRAELARRIGKSGAYVTQRLALLRLVPELRALLEDGALTIEQGRRLGDLPGDQQRAIAASGPPYRAGGVNAVKPPTARRPRTLRIGATPAAAAEAIRAQFPPAELAELLLLLKDDAR